MLKQEFFSKLRNKSTLHFLIDTLLLLIGMGGLNYILERKVRILFFVFVGLTWVAIYLIARRPLWKSREKLKSLISRAPVALSTLDHTGRYVYVNPKFTEIFGYTLEDIPTGKQWFGKAHPDPEYRKKVLTCWKEDLDAAKRGEAPPRVFTVTCKDGSSKEILFKHVVLTDETHLVTYEDITDRKKAEEALHQSEERYRNILDSIQDGYSEIDLAGNFTFVNNVTCKHLGYTKEELIGMHFHKYTNKDNGKRIKKLFTEAYTTGKSMLEVTDYELIRKDGTTGTYELSASLIRDEKGNIIGFRQLSRDVTERKKAEETLKKSEEKYRNILESMSEGFYELDLAGNFTFFNEAVCEVLGYTKDELTGMNNRRYTDKANAKRLFEAFNEVYRREESSKG
ncbi:MAG TPA: PAS domain S-box protein, partial [Thermodesulfobacteriota bacterium]|nr:PAS domain S-box protein [Thermodesulfobacteriota bacterium]